MTTAYPLHWPEQVGRTRQPQRARFKVKFADALIDLFYELNLLGATHVVISTNNELRRDGLPYANRREPDDTGVAVYFMRDGKQQCIAIDKWDRVKDNIRAIGLTVMALRGLDRWGGGSIVDAAFSGFAALPSPSPDQWWEVLGVNKSATSAEIKAAYRAGLKRHHDDTGDGDRAMLERVRRAYEEAT